MECYVEFAWHFSSLSLHRLSEEPTLDEEYRESDWLGDAENDLDEVKTNSVPLLSRDPDGASISEECPAVLTDGANLAEANGDHVVTSTVIDLQEVKESKKKSNLFSCFGPGRLSFGKKSRKFRPTSSAFIIWVFYYAHAQNAEHFFFFDKAHAQNA